MNKKIIGFLFLIGLIITSCSTRDYFGKLAEKEILIFQIEGQMGSTQIKDDSIYVTIPDDVYLIKLSRLSASTIKISDYATVSPTVGEEKDFSEPVDYTVTAEDGSTRVYCVIVQRGGSGNMQIPNSNFDSWYEDETGTTKYIDIGIDKDNKVWGTGNEGAAFAMGLGQVSDVPSKPYKISEGNYAAELTTTNMGSLASSALGGYKGVAAGNIFTGKFERGNLINARPVFGIPYTQTPIAFKVDFKYMPAEGLMNGRLNPVEGEDAMDMYLILEKREGDDVKRLGVGWYRSKETQEEWKTQEVDIKYATNGQAPEGVEEHAKYVLKYGHDGDISATDPNQMPKVTWGDITIDKPTHMFVVFTSSYMGDYFIGAPGSKLLVDNFELIY